MSEIKKVVLAYSGGLDTSVILKWLQESYGCQVVTFTVDSSQERPASSSKTEAGLTQRSPARRARNALRRSLQGILRVA